MRVATVTREFRQPIRRVNQAASGGSYVAIFTLQLTPTRDAADVTFGSEASDPHLESWIVSAIEQGIREFIAERERTGKPIGYLHVALVDISVHPTDSKEWRFTWAAREAMTEAFATHETFIET